jgi:hypothetical protein
VFKTGYNRVVLLIGRWAIKFANPASQRQFICGMGCNLKEYELHREAHGDPQIMTVYSIGFLGLWLVCKRYEVIDRALTPDEIAGIPLSVVDPKIGNFASDGGRIVVIDYGYSDSWYIGTHRPPKEPHG